MKTRKKLCLLALCVCAQVSWLPAQDEGADWANRDKQLQAAFLQFPLLTPATNSDGQPEFQKLPAESPVVIDGADYYGFRFQVPRRTQAEDFVWATLQPQFLIGWYILPEKGTMHGFENYRYIAKTTYRSTSKLLPAPLRRLIIQSLDGDSLKDGETYLIWWSLRGRARQMFLSFAFAPLGPDGLGQLGPMEKALALVRADGSPPPVAEKPSGAGPRGMGLGSMMENLMKDPDFMKTIAEQQAQMLKTQYAPLVKQLSLPPEQRDAFYKLLADNATNALAQGLAMLSGANNPGAASAAAGSQKVMQDQMRLLLGDSDYAQFQDFQSRMSMSMAQKFMGTNSNDDPGEP